MLLELAAPGARFPASWPTLSAFRRRAPRRRFAPAAAPAARPDGRDELVARIRAVEGEALEHPPLLFKATVALGSAMLAGAGLLVLGLAA